MASPWKVHGFTRMEGVVSLAVAAFLCCCLYLGVSDFFLKGQMVSCVSCCRQLQIATMSMANDGLEKGNPAEGWPGDLKARGVIRDTAGFATLLARNDYLPARDLRCFCEGPLCSSVPGFKPYHGELTPAGTLNPPFSEENNPFKIFLVRESDSNQTVFLETKNYTYGRGLNNPFALPFGDKGFVVCHKGGDVSIYKNEQARDTGPGWGRIGLLPGGGTAENCLNP